MHAITWHWKQKKSISSKFKLTNSKTTYFRTCIEPSEFGIFPKKWCYFFILFFLKKNQLVFLALRKENHGHLRKIRKSRHYAQKKMYFINVLRRGWKLCLLYAGASVETQTFFSHIFMNNISIRDVFQVVFSRWIFVPQAKEESLKRYPAQKHLRGLVTTTLGLHLPLDSETVLNGAVRVRCVALLSPVLWTSDNEKVLPRQDKREALLLGKSSWFLSGTIKTTCKRKKKLI